MHTPVRFLALTLPLLSLLAADADAGVRSKAGNVRLRRAGKTRIEKTVLRRRAAAKQLGGRSLRPSRAATAGEQAQAQGQAPVQAQPTSQATRTGATLRPAERAKLAVKRVEDAIASEVGGSWTVTARPNKILDDSVHSVTGYGLTRVKAKNNGRRYMGAFKKDSVTQYDVLITRDGKAVLLDTDEGSRAYRTLNWFFRRLPKIIVGLGKSKGVRAGVAGGVPTVGLAGSATLVVATTLASGLVGASADSAERKASRRAHDGAVQRTAERIQASGTSLDIHDAYGIYQSELNLTADIVGAKPMDEAAFAVALRAKGF